MLSSFFQTSFEEIFHGNQLEQHTVMTTTRQTYKKKQLKFQQKLFEQSKEWDDTNRECTWILNVLIYLINSLCSYSLVFLFETLVSIRNAERERDDACFLQNKNFLNKVHNI